MNISDGRFKVQTYLRMARISTDEIDRQRYLEMAEETMVNMYQLEKYENPIHLFVEDMIVFEKSARTPRRAIYECYVDYCRKNNYIALSRNALYKTLREDFNITELKNEGYVFCAHLKLKESEETEC